MTNEFDIKSMMHYSLDMVDKYFQPSDILSFHFKEVISHLEKSKDIEMSKNSCISHSYIDEMKLLHHADK